MQVMNYCCHLLLWSSAIICLSSGILTLETESNITVYEDEGNVSVCLNATERTDVSAYSEPNTAVLGVDYEFVNKCFTVMPDNNYCVTALIIDDNITDEANKTFDLVFVENITESGEGSGGSASVDNPLVPPTMLDVLITIIDNDVEVVTPEPTPTPEQTSTPITPSFEPPTGSDSTTGATSSSSSTSETTTATTPTDAQTTEGPTTDRGTEEDTKATPSVIAGAVCGSIAGATLIIIICLLFCNYYTKRKKRILLRRSSDIDGAYIAFNSHVIPHSDRDDTKNNGYHLGSSSPTASIHDAIVDVEPPEFSAYVKELHRDADKGFSRQFMALQEHSPTSIPCHAANLPKNCDKNRYQNILPYDETRVCLKTTNKKDSDYINASWIHGYKKEKAYVTCQGPLPETVGDFWRMVWELNIPTIVMVTKTMEANKVKCEQYWPDKVGEIMCVNNEKLIVKLSEVVPFADYDLRKITILCDDEKRDVVQYHFQAWPDHGVPRYATALLGFIRNVRRSHFPSDPSPLVVHCSAGVGRTGTFIVLDMMLQVLEARAGINVYQCILKMRNQRCTMVQTEAQYVFIHDALEELITCGKTEISATNLRIAMKRLDTPDTTTNLTGFQKQFELLEQVTRQPLKKDLETAQKVVNMGKNRHPNMLPYDFQRVCLRLTGQQGSDYINASWINGYRQSNAFMVTQAPLENTVNDLWRMVWESGTKTIVMLCDLLEDKAKVSNVRNEKTIIDLFKEVQYWPEPQQKETYGNIIVSGKNEEIVNDALCTRTLELVRSGTLATTTLEVKTITQFHFRGWKRESLPSHPSLLLEMVDRVLKNQRSTGNKPVVVMCSDGSGCSGVFVVLYTQLERLKTEHVLDVFQGIKSARIQRMGIVHNSESYELIHQLLLEYLTSFQESNYDNFRV